MKQTRLVEPTIYAAEEHGIDLNDIDSKALYILDKLRAAGHSAYLVGGGVRDLLLNKKPKDFDISTSAKPEEIKPLFSHAFLIGKRFRLAHVRFGRKVFEVSTFRAGNTENDKLIVEDNLWGSPEEDALRRDFTINALFYDSENQTVIDYVGGYQDIEHKVIRAIGQPYCRFKQDPVRMIRCLKFQARFGLEVEEEARLALIECRSEITKSAQARVLEEILRMLESGSSAPFFRLMTDHGILQQLLPAVAEFLERPEGNEVYSFLEEADGTIKEPHQPELSRPILIACMLFPILEKRLKVRYQDREKIPHLGEIFTEVHHTLDDVFHTYFRLPKKLKTSAASILVSQYRMTPFQKRKNRRIRIPRVPDFGWAIEFFNLRCRLEPGLQEIGDKWNEAFSEAKDTPRRRKPRHG